ncbi:AAA family ATPase (plasmid) [Fibrella sp. USSR17]
MCHGPAGVGKTWAARYFSHWEATTHHIQQAYYNLVEPRAAVPMPRAVFYTVPVTNTPRSLRDDLALQFDLFGQGSRLSGHFPEGNGRLIPPLLMVDEADRLAVNSLEYLRDLYDRLGFGLVLIGMPGLEKRLKRYAQLYSRVGFAHAFRVLTADDLRGLLLEPLPAGGFAFGHAPFQDEAALGAVIRTCRGNLRLLVRLLGQIERIADLNGLTLISSEVVTAATRLLTIGPLD